MNKTYPVIATINQKEHTMKNEADYITQYGRDALANARATLQGALGQLDQPRPDGKQVPFGTILR